MGEPNGAVNALLAEFRSVARSIKEAGGTALKEWTLQDLTVGLAVLARQQSSLLAESQSSRQFLCLHDFKLHSQLRYYITLAHAAYEHSMDRVCHKAGLNHRDLVMGSCGEYMRRPAHFVALDHRRRAIVVVIRGTQGFGDIMTISQLAPMPFLSGYGHRGIVESAAWCAERLGPVLADLHYRFPHYALRMCGHSLGGGVAALTTLMLRKSLPTLHCVVFAPPACVSQQLARDATEAVTAVVVGDDLVPRLSPASVETLRSQVLRVDWTQEVAVFSKLGVLPPLQQWVNKTMSSVEDWSGRLSVQWQKNLAYVNAMAQQLEDWAALKDGAARLAAAKGEEEGGLDGVAALRRRWEQLEREFEEAMRSWVRRWNERSSTSVAQQQWRDSVISECESTETTEDKWLRAARAASLRRATWQALDRLAVSLQGSLTDAWSLLADGDGKGKSMGSGAIQQGGEQPSRMALLDQASNTIKAAMVSAIDNTAAAAATAVLSGTRMASGSEEEVREAAAALTEQFRAELVSGQLPLYIPGTVLHLLPRVHAGATLSAPCLGLVPRNYFHCINLTPFVFSDHLCRTTEHVLDIILQRLAAPPDIESDAQHWRGVMRGMALDEAPAKLVLAEAGRDPPQWLEDEYGGGREGMA